MHYNKISDKFPHNVCSASKKSFEADFIYYTYIINFLTKAASYDTFILININSFLKSKPKESCSQFHNLLKNN